MSGIAVYALIAFAGQLATFGLCAYMLGQLSCPKHTKEREEKERAS